jgi:hypothetical protein
MQDTLVFLASCTVKFHYKKTLIWNRKIIFFNFYFCYQIFDTYDKKWKIIMVESKSEKNDFMNLK